VQAASVIALLACLQSEAAAATVPSGLMVQLRDLTPAGGGTGATAALSDRAVRWSRPRMSLMTRIALAGSVLLLIGGAAAPFLITASEAPPVQSVTVVPAPAPTPASAPEGDLDPERAHGWMTVHWTNGVRTAERLRRLPEMALLADMAPGVLDQIAGLHEAAVVLRPDEVLPREQRVKQYTLQREMLDLTAEQQMQRMTANLDEQIEQSKSQSAAGTHPSPFQVMFAGSAGRFTFASPEAMQPVAGILDRGGFGLVPVAGTADGWALGDGGLVRLVRHGNRLDLHGSVAPLVPDPIAGPWPASAADLEMVFWFDSGLPGATPLRSATMDFSVTKDGLRLACATPWQTTRQRQAADSWPRLDQRRLDAVPASAFLACAVPLSAEETAKSVFMRSMLHTMAFAASAGSRSADANTKPNQAGSVIEALCQAISQIDGTFVAWVEPGVPVPTVTVEADLPQVAADALIAATGEPRAADGSITSFQGMVSLTIGWQDGRLIFTTVPGGLAAIDRRGGFTTHKDVQRAFAAMPSKQSNLCAVLRPAALVDCVAPFVAMAGPTWSKRLEDYTQRLERDSSYSYFTIAGDAQGLRMDAAGLLSLVAGGVLAAAAQTPARIAN
jgi:hypothetical protein